MKQQYFSVKTKWSDDGLRKICKNVALSTREPDMALAVANAIGDLLRHPFEFAAQLAVFLEPDQAALCVDDDPVADGLNLAFAEAALAIVKHRDDVEEKRHASLYGTEGQS
jgi:hypothetical protein